MACVQKVGRNFYLPPPVNDVFNELVSGLGEKQKWTVITAAILEYLSLPQEVKQQRIQEMANADFGSGPERFDALISAAKSAANGRTTPTPVLNHPGIFTANNMPTKGAADSRVADAKKRRRDEGKEKK